MSRKDTRKTDLFQRLLTVFEEKKIGIVHTCFLIDRKGEDDISALSGIEDGIAAQFQCPGRLFQTQTGTKT